MFQADPNFPHIVLSFEYRGFTLDLDQGDDDGVPVYSVWANHDWGCAVAVRGVVSRSEAIYKAKQWVNRRLQG